MDKPSIFIASSGRTLTLANKLGDMLKENDLSEPMLWTEESRRNPGATIIEMLQASATKYDFAVIILAKDDVMLRGESEALKARDNCVFEAGLFISALGRDRCFLVNSVDQRDLPSDLGGIISLPFQEPKNFADPTVRKSAVAAAFGMFRSLALPKNPGEQDECKSAMAAAFGVIKDRVQTLKRNKNRPLSAAELLSRERLQSKHNGGELYEDQVVVTSTQPLESEYLPALQIKNNIEDGVRYVYVFHGTSGGAQKICQLLQMMLLAPMLNPAKAVDFATRESKIKEEQVQSRIVNDLAAICANESLKIFFLPAVPNLQYCIHNATSVHNATLYFKQRDKFILWETGAKAYEFWEEVRKRQGNGAEPPNAVLHGAFGFDVKEDSFSRTFKTEVERYFPGIHEKVTRLCFDGKLA